MNACSIFVYRPAMRCFLFLLLLPTGLIAQPAAPALSFVLVENERGRPMRGTIAENGMMVELLNAQGKHPWMVRQLFKVSAAYPYGPERPGDHVQWTMLGAPLQLGGRRYLWFELSDCYCEDQQVVVQRDGQLMRIRVPNDPHERQPMVDAAIRRSGDHASPEVFRFRPGTFTFAELAAEPAFAALEAQLAHRLERDCEAAYRKQLAEQERSYTMHPATTPAAQQEVPLPTEEEVTRAMPARPGLEQVAVARVHADTVWVKITGRVLLNGGCASGMPLFGIEMLTDTGGVERIPFELVQMDCGMPWADWEDHVVMMPPLRWWIAAHQPEGSNAMLPGSYRLVFVGGDLESVRTGSFPVF